jgi:hypothetical protein
LEHSNSRMAIQSLDEDERGVSKVYTLGGPQEVTIISESGFYSLVIRSNKPQAKPFRKWVTSEVLPSIRKTGSYNAPQPLPLIGSESVPTTVLQGRTYYHGMAVKRLLGMSVRTSWSYARKSFGAYFHKNPLDGAQYITFEYAKLMIDSKALRDMRLALKAYCLEIQKTQLELFPHAQTDEV